MTTARFGHWTVVLVGLLLLSAVIVDAEAWGWPERRWLGQYEASRKTPDVTHRLEQVRARSASRAWTKVRALRSDIGRTTRAIPSVYQLVASSPQTISANAPRAKVGQNELGSIVSEVPRESRPVERTDAQSGQAATKSVPPKIHVSCVLHNHPYDLYDAQTQRAIEKDDWRVRCTVTWKKQTVYDDELTLPRPTEFRDAMVAVDEFRSKRAPQLVKEWEDAAKRK